MNNEELVKKNIEEKDKVKLKYNRKLNDIKQHYGIDFDVEHFKDEKIKSTKFKNLKHKKGYDNLSVIYNCTNGKIDFIDYDYTDSRIIKASNHRKLVLDLEKDFKLNLVVSEIQRANAEYLKDINEIEVAYHNENQKNLLSERLLEIDKDEES